MAISRWFIPCSSGDFRLEAKGEKKSLLTVQDPTPLEAERLTRFLSAARERSWLGRCRNNVSLVGSSKVVLKAPVAETGALLAEIGGLQSRPGVLTAIRSVGGEISVVESAEAAAKEAQRPAAASATTVRRATPSCPDTFVAIERRASEVLRAFTTPDQWATWSRSGYLLCTGGMSGHVYRLAHRHSPVAATQRRICFDLTDQGTLHFHDTLMPAPEEVLAAMLILRFREDWLRNQATCLGAFSDVYDNPLGPGISDGVWDSSVTSVIGQSLLQLTGGAPLPLSLFH